MKSLLFHKTKISKRYPFRVKPPSLTHYNEYPLRLNLSNVTYFEVSICEEIALYWFDHIAKSSLIRPDETHHIVCCNTKQFRKEPILHGRIRLYHVSPLSHSKYVFYGGFLVFLARTLHLPRTLSAGLNACAINLVGYQRLRLRQRLHRSIIARDFIMNYALVKDLVVK